MTSTPRPTPPAGTRPTVDIGSVSLDSPFALAPMAGMTDTAFRRLVKRGGGCGLVVTEMVSSEGLVRGIDRTLEYAEYTEEERPVSIQIFGGDPGKMAAAAEIVEGMGADIVDVNMGCPVPKIAKHHAGCSLMRTPEHAAEVIGAMARAVSIPVTVKMRSGWDGEHVNAPDLARRVEQAGAAAVAVHGRTAAQSYTGRSDWSLIDEVAREVSIPVFGSGDCVTPADLVERMRGTAVAGVLVGRGALRNPWIFDQARTAWRGGDPPPVSLAERGRFLLAYVELLLSEATEVEREGFRHTACLDRRVGPKRRSAASRERWIVNKLRALGSWYTKGIDRGSHLRTAINSAPSLDALRAVIRDFFDLDPSPAPGPLSAAAAGSSSATGRPVAGSRRDSSPPG